jgi:hypothetical protein
MAFRDTLCISACRCSKDMVTRYVGQSGLGNPRSEKLRRIEDD